jgi:serine/threonine protein kinase/WD40 repeat protein
MTNHCSATLLESALAGSLSAGDEVALERHLDECEACSDALERLAGWPEWRAQATSLLTEDELEAIHAQREDWAVDFTVEHLEASDEPGALGKLGEFEILEIIGHGGMGVVLKALDRKLNRRVAIKVLSPHLAQNSLARKRFAREAQAAAAVVHPNVLAIHQVQPNGPLPFLVMPLVAGESVAERLTERGTLELNEILRIGMQAAAGLAAAHEQGLVHRDVKPANILLEKGVERAVLTDFGLARAADDVTLTRWGIIAGTPQYMSPEQARGEALNGRSDLFSLGCVLYEMATGVSPFRADSLVATMRRLVDDEPRAMASLNPELPTWFIAIVERLLEKEPANRFGSAKEVSELLEGCLAHVQQPTNVPLPENVPQTKTMASGAKSGSGRWRHRWRATIVALGLIGFGGWGVFMLVTAEQSDISGDWSGESWGKVTLQRTSSAHYSGTYTDTHGKEPGKIELKWSRIEGRYNGRWSEGEDRFGKISVRQVGDEILGAWTTNRKSEINSGTPSLSDLVWTREAHADDRNAHVSKNESVAGAIGKTDDRTQPPGPGGIGPGPGIRRDPTPASQNDGQTLAGHFRGHVTNANGKPVPGAWIFLLPPNDGFSDAPAGRPKPDVIPIRAKTDSNGRFEFDAPDMTVIDDDGLQSPQRCLVIAMADGYGPDWKKITGRSHVWGGWVIQNPVNKDDLALQLPTDDVPIQGRLLDPNGRPIAGAQIRLTRLMIPKGRDLNTYIEYVSRNESGEMNGPDFEEQLSFEDPLPGVSPETRTDSDGRFTLSGIGRERLAELQVTAPAMVDTTITVMTRNAPDLGTLRIHGKPTQTTYGAKFTAQLKPGVTITGVVRDRDTKEPIPGMWVGLRADPLSALRWGEYSRITDRNGRFTLSGVDSAFFDAEKPGKVTAVSAPGLPFETAIADVKKGSETIIECQRGIPFRLKLLDDKGWPVEAEVTYRELQPNGHLPPTPYVFDGRWPVSRAAHRGRGIYEGFVLPGPGAVLVKTHAGNYRSAHVDPKGFFAPGRTDWSPLERITAYGDENHLSSSEVLINQRDYAAIVLVNPPPNSAPLELSTTVYSNEPSTSAQLLADRAVEAPAASPPPATAPATPAAQKPGTSESDRTRRFTTNYRVNIIAASPDGKLLAINNRHYGVDILDAKTDKTIESFNLGEQTMVWDAIRASDALTDFMIGALAFSPDSNVVAIGTDIGQVELYNPRTGEVLRALDDEKGKAAVKYTSDMFTGLKPNGPEQWNRVTRAQGTVESLAFSPDGRLLATCGESFDDFAIVFRQNRERNFRTGPGRLKIWDVRTGNLVPVKHDLVGHSEALAVAFSSDGSLLASAGQWKTDNESGSGVILWNTQTWVKVRTISTNADKANRGTRSVTFSPDGKQIAFSSLNYEKDGTYTSVITLAEVGSGKIIWQRTIAGTVKRVAFYDGAVIAMVDGKETRFLTPESGSTLMIIGFEATIGGGQWHDFAIGKKGHMIAYGGQDKDWHGIIEVLDPAREN